MHAHRHAVKRSQVNHVPNRLNCPIRRSIIHRKERVMAHWSLHGLIASIWVSMSHCHQVSWPHLICSFDRHSDTFLSSPIPHLFPLNFSILYKHILDLCSYLSLSCAFVLFCYIVVFCFVISFFFVFRLFFRFLLFMMSYFFVLFFCFVFGRILSNVSQFAFFFASIASWNRLLNR